MAQSLNLIPEQEVQEQTQKKVVKMSSLFSIMVLVVTSGVAAYFIYNTTTVSGQIKSEEAKITSLRNDIQSMASIEITARNLGKKYTTLKSLLDKRVYFSYLMEELKIRKPAEITLKSFSILKGNKLAISGQAQTYITITTFGNNLLAKDFAGGNPRLSGIFTSIILNQVDLSQSGTVEFSMTIDYDPTKLTYAQ